MQVVLLTFQNIGILPSLPLPIFKNGEGTIRDRVYSAEQEILAVSRGATQGKFEGSEEFIKNTQDNFMKKANSNIKKEFETFPSV